MAETTPKGAADALATHVRLALQCITAAEVLSSGSARGITNSLLILSKQAVRNDYLLLRRPDRSPYLQLEVSMEYAVVSEKSEPNRHDFVARVRRYFFGVANLDDRELFAYHWHPDGSSDVITPHLHVSVAPPVLLPGRAEASDSQRLVIGKLHFPTHHNELPELIRFLITELGVGPRRTDWEVVLDQIERSTP